MQSDAATRILLASILLCLLILVVRGSTGERGPEVGRYSVTGMRAGGPILVRADSVTGRTWKLELHGSGERWVEFRDAEPGAAASAPLDQPDQEGANPVGGNQPLQ
jgi:hypothetical protein